MTLAPDDTAPDDTAPDDTVPGTATAGVTRRPKRRSWYVTDVLSVGWLVTLALATLLLPTLLHLDTATMSAADRLQGPFGDAFLGTDEYGRSLFARCLAGARVSLLIGFGSVAAAAIIGVPLGMLAGYLRGWVDAVISFIVDVVMAFPGRVLALALAAFLGASVTNVMIAITVPMTPVFVRLSKAQTLSISRRDYVEASQVIGTPTRSILARDVLPNISQAILAYALVSVGTAILIEGGLSFLGLGVPPSQPSWGAMINDGTTFISSEPYLIAVPSAFMLMTILSLNLVADRFLSGPQQVAAVV